MLFVLAAMPVSSAFAEPAETNPMLLWYDKPAAEWVAANPVGNGRLGAMVFGGTARERLQINEDTLWIGEPHDYSHQGAFRFLPDIRKLLFEGKQKEAEKLAMDQFMSVPLRQPPYQPCGDLLLELPGHEEFAEYRRELDLDRAVATVRYRVGDTVFTREVFASHPAGVVFVRISANRPAKVSFVARLGTEHPNASVAAGKPMDLILSGQVRNSADHFDGTVENPLRFELRARVMTEGGESAPVENGIEVTNADAATLLVSAATNYVDFKDVTGDPAARNERLLAVAAAEPYASQLERHVADHRGLFRRVSIDLGPSAGPKLEMPTDQRLKAFADGDDPRLAAQFFQFGRYLMIGCSRPGSQPANLQGLWNDKLQPPWDSKYTININTEMNYWPAESCNLAECHLPLFDALEELAVSGEKVAREHYKARGWVVHHNFDLWRGAAPINASNHGIWPMGAAWLCQHLWWHYEYSGDRDFLAKRAYPLMKGAALFFVDTLVEDPRTDKGWLISGPSNSPENGGLVMGPTMDHQIIRNLFTSVILAGEALGVDEDLRKQLAGLRSRIAPNQIGRFGQLQEWLEDKDDPNNQHRHTSHLWGLHPGSEINASTPALFEAAKVSLQHRGDGGTGWSKAWKVNFWARFLDGDHSYRMLSSLVSTGTYPNMFDAHPPFQIDGNFGAASGMVEMLLQNHLGEIAFLPALPAAWPDGEFRGLRARNGVEVDLEWKGGKAVRASLKTSLAVRHTLRPPRGQKIKRIIDFGGEPVAVETAGETGSFDAGAGGAYAVEFE